MLRQLYVQEGRKMKDIAVVLGRSYRSCTCRAFLMKFLRKGGHDVHRPDRSHPFKSNYPPREGEA
jgi:hypothetical protein